MYTVKTHNLGQNSSRLDMTNYLPGSDIFNSELMDKLDNYPELNVFKITKNEYRIDRISEDIYGDSSYSWILLYLNRCLIDDLVIGRNIVYIPKLYLDQLINSL